MASLFTQLALYHTSLLSLSVFSPTYFLPFLSLVHLKLHNSTDASVCQLQSPLCTLGFPVLFRRQGLGSAPGISKCNYCISQSHKSGKVLQNCVNFVPCSFQRLYILQKVMDSSGWSRRGNVWIDKELGRC